MSSLLVDSLGVGVSQNLLDFCFFYQCQQCEMCKALQELTDLAPSDECQKELRLSRRREDNAALDKMIQYFSHMNPFPSTKELRSISTGVTAEPAVNPECAAEVGTKILESMDGHSVADYKFSKKAQIKSLASVHYIEAEGEN